MSRRETLVLFFVLLLIGGTAGAVCWVRGHQKLGKPGIRTTPVSPDTVAMKIDLPERVLDFTSTNVPEPEIVANYLPKDTSYAGRLYSAPDGFWVNATAILMGTDRTSIHKADYCLTGQGLEPYQKSEIKISVGGPKPDVFPAASWLVRGNRTGANGEKVEVHGLYVFWFVADNERTARHGQLRLWQMWDTLRTFGTLQRWAYISYFAPCMPGQENATLERVTKLIEASVPEFQLPPTDASPMMADKR